MESTATDNLQSLKNSWENLKRDNPKMRIRDAAHTLGVPEAELLATQLGEGVTRLEGSWSEMLNAFKKLGKVMALTRNDGCVLEHKGNFQKIEIHGTAPNEVATVIGPIEQRIFFSSWKFGFSVVQDTPRGTMRSLQFFDKAGEAILKVYLQEKSNIQAYEEFVFQYAAAYQSPELEIESIPEPTYAEDIDLASFTHDWENMKDTHDFFGMLRKYKVSRLDAVKWIDDKWAYEIDRLSARKILDKAAECKLPIMIFAGNRGNIQIHQGKVRTIRQMGDWLNVLDPDFNMHLDENKIAQAFVVHKNTADGLVSSVELFDESGEMIAQFFGLRKPGLAQLPQWKELVDNL
jgi:putative hemin transport protein